jgi:hypothetical protein
MTVNLSTTSVACDGQLLIGPGMREVIIMFFRAPMGLLLCRLYLLRLSPFYNQIKVIQENALQSLVRLFPPCEIILFGDQEGVAEAAVHFGMRHVPEVSRNEYGTPLLDDLFLRAQKVATNGVMCHINAEIILMSEFIKAVEIIRKSKNPFLLVGRRWNINVGGPLDFSRPDWDDQFRTYVRQSGNLIPLPCFYESRRVMGLYHENRLKGIG